MKVKRDARQRARKLFKLCFRDGALDQQVLRDLISRICQARPRHAAEILSHLHKLTSLEVQRRTLTIETAADPGDAGRALFDAAERRLGTALVRVHRVNPSLIGGARIQFGDDVWDDSVRQRLRNLERSMIGL